MGEFIYLDNAATTKTAPEAVEAMLPYFTDFYGNPSSIYSLGASAQKAVEEAREQIASTLRAMRYILQEEAPSPTTGRW